MKTLILTILTAAVLPAGLVHAEWRIVQAGERTFKYESETGACYRYYFEDVYQQGWCEAPHTLINDAGNEITTVHFIGCGEGNVYRKDAAGKWKFIRKITSETKD